jgi:hypothetical protein
VEEMRAQRAKVYNELKNNRNSREFEEWFLSYTPNPTAITSDKKMPDKKMPDKKMPDKKVKTKETMYKTKKNNRSPKNKKKSKTQKKTFDPYHAKK